MADKTQCVVCSQSSQVEVTSADADPLWYCLADAPSDAGVADVADTPSTYAVMAPDIEEATPVEETPSNKKSTKGVS